MEKHLIIGELFEFIKIEKQIKSKVKIEYDTENRFILFEQYEMFFCVAKNHLRGCLEITRSATQ